MYTILPDGTVASVGRDEEEGKVLTIVEIVAKLRDAYEAGKN